MISCSIAVNDDPARPMRRQVPPFKKGELEVEADPQLLNFDQIAIPTYRFFKSN